MDLHPDPGVCVGGGGHGWNMEAMNVGNRECTCKSLPQWICKSLPQWICKPLAQWICKSLAQGPKLWIPKPLASSSP